MLNVSSFLRPSCEQILEKDFIKKKAEQLNISIQNIEEVKDVLMQTIQIPNNFFKLSEKLPKPNYSTENSPSPYIRPNAPEKRKCNINSKVLQIISEGNDLDCNLPSIKKPPKLFDIPLKGIKHNSLKNIENIGSDIIKEIDIKKPIISYKKHKISPSQPSGIQQYQSNIYDKVSKKEILLENIESARKKKNHLYNKYIRELLNEKLVQRENEIEMNEKNRREAKKSQNPYLKNNLIQFMEYDKNNQVENKKRRMNIDKTPQKLKVIYPKKRGSN